MSPHVEQYRSAAALDARVDLHRRYTPRGRDVWDLVWDTYPLRAGDRVLEVGCGSGGFWLHGNDAVRLDLNLTLTDASEAMLASASERLGARGVRAVYERASVEDLPFSDGAFDVALSHFMLYHVSQKEHAVRELLRVTRTGGWVGVVLTGPENMGRIYELAASASPDRSIAKSDSMRFTAVEAEPLLRSVFAAVERVDYRYTMAVDDADVLVRYAQSCPTFPSQDDARFWDAYRTAVVEDIERRGAAGVEKQAAIFRCR